MANGFETAKRLMGPNFIGPDDLSSDIKDYFRIRFSEQQLEEIKSPFWSGFAEKILLAKSPFHPGKKVFEDHFFCWSGKTASGHGGQSSICDLAKRKFSGARQPKIFRYPAEEQLYERFPFGTENHCCYAWYLFPVFLPDEYAGKSLDQQLGILPSSYFHLTAVEMVYISFVIFLKNGVRINTDMMARCSDSVENGRDNINVGMFNYSGLAINCSSAKQGSERVTIATAKKLVPPSFR